MKTGSPILFVDVRPREAYDDQHIREAIWLPLIDFPRKHAELPRDKPIVTY